MWPLRTLLNDWRKWESKRQRNKLVFQAMQLIVADRRRTGRDASRHERWIQQYMDCAGAVVDSFREMLRRNP